ncbi:MAG: DUF4329 domain-containing protein [Planctomycetes bacterium]|nr:DUF4329 domain-containing protein [Planctomycetota bacterium]
MNNRAKRWAVVLIFLLAGLLGGYWFVTARKDRDEKGAGSGAAENAAKLEPGQGKQLLRMEPEDGAVVSGTETLVRFFPRLPTTGRVYWRASGGQALEKAEAILGEGLIARLSPLKPGTTYEYVIEVDMDGGTDRSPVRKFVVQKGLAFEPATVTQTIARDYDQTVTLTLQNGSDRKVEVAARALAHFAELPADIVGPGSADAPIVLEAGEKINLRLAVTAADAAKKTYDIPIQAAGVFALAKITVGDLDFKLALRVIEEDPVTLAQSIELRNVGDDLTDLAIQVPPQNRADVRLEPAADHAYLPAGKTMRLRAAPVLYLEFEGLDTELVCEAGGKTLRFPVQFKVPAAKRLLGLRLGTQERTSSSDWYCTNKPKTCSDLPGPRANGPAHPSSAAVQPPRRGSCRGGESDCTPECNDPTPYLKDSGIRLGINHRGPGPRGTLDADDCFPSADAAALDVIRKLNPISYRANKEFGGRIFKAGDNCYIWLFDCAGNEGCVSQRDPFGSETGYWHTHGYAPRDPRTGQPRGDYERWSAEDLNNDSSRTQYLGTPRGNIVKITITEGKQVNENDGQKYDPNSDSWVPTNPQRDPIIIPAHSRLETKEPPLLAQAAARPHYRLERIGLLEALRYRAVFSRLHRGLFACASAGNLDDSSSVAAGWHAGERVSFAWHQDQDQIAVAIFDSQGKSVQEPLVVGKGRWPYVAGEGKRVAVAWEQEKESKVRLFDDDQWQEEISLSGNESALAFAPDGTLFAVSSAGLWQLKGQTFERLQDSAFSQPALAIDAKGLPRVAWRKNGRIFIGDQEVAEGERPTLTITSAGKTHLAYLHNGQLFQRTREDKDWTNPEAIPAKSPSWPALALGRDEVRISYIGPADHGPEALWLVRLPAKEPLLLPSLAGNISEAWLLLQLSLRSARTEYRPHDVALYFNDMPIKHFSKAIPEGRYWLPLNPHLVFASPGRPVSNRVAVRTRHMNGGHYSTASEYQLITRTDWSEHFGFAANPEELLGSHKAGRRVNHDQADLAVLANSLDLPAKAPPDGRVDFPVTVANLGEMPSRSARLLMKHGMETLAHAPIPTLPPGEEFVVSFRLHGLLSEVQFQLEQPEDDFDPSNDILRLHLWPVDENKLKSERPRVEVLRETPMANDVPIDPDALIAYDYDGRMRFGLTVLKDAKGAAVKKRLTFGTDGNTNSCVVKIDGKAYGLEDKWIEKAAKIPEDPAWQSRAGTKSVWRMGDIQVTQILEIVPGKQPVEKAPGVPQRLLDTLLVRYRLENLGKEKHEAGLRLMIDTLIGNNDGVPFTVPGLADLVTGSKDFQGIREVPEFIQALEKPSLADPGTIALLTLRVPGLEPPGRVSLTHWPGANNAWDIAMQDIGSDSAAVLYWQPRALAPGEVRELGFTYGIGALSQADKGRLALGVEGVFQVGKAFTLIAYVHEPLENEALVLSVPPGLELVQGSPRRLIGQLPAAAKTGHSLVTWRLRALQPGNHILQVQSSNGAVASRTVAIAGSRKR